MSKFNITGFADKDITPQLLSPLVDKFLEITKELPETIVLTDEQWGKFFFSAGERLNNFRGIPLETPATEDHTAIVLKTIAAVLQGMHTSSVREVAEVYRLLEGMKSKIGGQSGS